jgi:hypothetical protein
MGITMEFYLETHFGLLENMKDPISGTTSQKKVLRHYRFNSYFKSMFKRYEKH